MHDYRVLTCIGSSWLILLLSCLYIQRDRVRSPSLVIGGAKRPNPTHIPRVKVAAYFLANGTQVGIGLFVVLYLHGRGYIHLESRSSFNALGVLRFVAEFYLFFMLADTWFYWGHRLAHFSRKIYRHAHAVHHEVRFPNVWFFTYHHPLDFLAVGVLPRTLIAFLPFNMGMSAYLAALLFSYLTDLGGHAGYELTRHWRGEVFSPGGWAIMIDPRRRWIARLFTTCLHHDLHHQAYVKNFGLYFMFWDRVCGTLHADTERPEKYVEEPMP